MAESGKEQDSSAKTPSKNKGRTRRVSKRAKVALVVIVAVFAVSGIGFSQWHETPAFCGAICHDPMDAYVSSYIDGEYDVYGNKMEDEAQSVAMAAYLHKVDHRTTCLQCHEPTLAEQLSQGVSWLTGDYTTAGTNAQGQSYLKELTTEELVNGGGNAASQGGSSDEDTSSQDSSSQSTTGDQFCLKAGCHTDFDKNDILDRSQLTQMTEYLGKYNPHLFLQDEKHDTVQCSDCHKAHSRSVNTCTECHADAPVPNGWLNYDERQQIEEKAFDGN